MTNPDLELLAAWRAGDKQAGNELFSRHFDPISRFFRNKIDGAVNDLVQEVFLACLKGRESFRAESSFRTYIFKIARFKLYDFLRARSRAEVDFTTSSVADLGASPLTILAKKRERRLLLRALRAIPVDFQIALELYYWEGLTGPELADIIGVSPHTVRSRLHRARQALEKVLAKLADSPALATATMTELEAGSLTNADASRAT